MLRKQNTHQKVWSIIETDTSIKKNLLNGIINVRALALYLIKKNKLNCSTDSVISSIRRYCENNEIIIKENKIVDLFKNSVLKTKNNVICITLKKEANLLEWYNQIKEMGKDTRVITGEHATKIFLHNGLIDMANKYFQKKDIISKTFDLSEISLTINQESIKTKGVLAKITGEIAINDINIEELIVCPPEYVIYVKNSDLLKSHEVLYKIGNGK